MVIENLTVLNHHHHLSWIQIEWEFMVNWPQFQTVNSSSERATATSRAKSHTNAAREIQKTTSAKACTVPVKNIPNHTPPTTPRLSSRTTSSTAKMVTMLLQKLILSSMTKTKWSSLFLARLPQEFRGSKIMSNFSMTKLLKMVWLKIELKVWYWIPIWAIRKMTFRCLITMLNLNPNIWPIATGVMISSILFWVES